MSVMNVLFGMRGLVEQGPRGGYWKMPWFPPVVSQAGHEGREVGRQIGLDQARARRVVDHEQDVDVAGRRELAARAAGAARAAAAHRAGGSRGTAAAPPPARRPP